MSHVVCGMLHLVSWKATSHGNAMSRDVEMPCLMEMPCLVSWKCHALSQANNISMQNILRVVTCVNMCTCRNEVIIERYRKKPIIATYYEYMH